MDDIMNDFQLYLKSSEELSMVLEQHAPVLLIGKGSVQGRVSNTLSLALEGASESSNQTILQKFINFIKRIINWISNLFSSKKEATKDLPSKSEVEKEFNKDTAQEINKKMDETVSKKTQSSRPTSGEKPTEKQEPAPNPSEVLSDVEKVAYKEDSPDARFNVTIRTIRTDAYFDVFDITAQYWRFYKTIDINPSRTETMNIQDIMFLKR